MLFPDFVEVANVDAAATAARLVSCQQEDKAQWASVYANPHAGIILDAIAAWMPDVLVENFRRQCQVCSATAVRDCVSTCAWSVESKHVGFCSLVRPWVVIDQLWISDRPFAMIGGQNTESDCCALHA